MSDLFRPGGAAEASIGARAERRTFAIRDERWWRVVKRRGLEGISVVQIERAKLGSADAGCVLQHGLKHGLQIARRAGDDAQHLRCGPLLLPRLGELAREQVDIFLFRERAARPARAARCKPPTPRGKLRMFAFSGAWSWARDLSNTVNVNPAGPAMASLTCDPRAAAAGSRPAARIRPAWCRSRRTRPRALFHGSPRAHARKAR